MEKDTEVVKRFEETARKGHEASQGLGHLPRHGADSIKEALDKRIDGFGATCSALGLVLGFMSLVDIWMPLAEGEHHTDNTEKIVRTVHAVANVAKDAVHIGDMVMRACRLHCGAQGAERDRETDSR